MFKKANFFILVLLFFMPIVSGIIAFFLPVWQMENSMAATKEAMAQRTFSCASSQQAREVKWGNEGYARFCVVISADEREDKNGAWEGWEDGYLKIEGQYRNNFKEGKWTSYTAKGAVYRVMVYDRGELISDNIEARG